MKVTTRRHVTHTLTLDDDIELEILFEPIGDPTVERDGDKIKVGYLVQDEGSGSNPIDDDHCNGKLVYDRQMDQSLLGLDGYGNPDIDFRFDMPGHHQTTLAELLQIDSSNDREVVDDAKVMALYREHFNWICRWAVPVDYHDFGSGGTKFRISQWVGNSIGVPNAVWIADQNARDNLEFDGKVPTRAEIEEYCKNVLEEYEKWCNGEVYGVVVETFEWDDNNQAWGKTDGRDNECWGHVGYVYAKEALTEAMAD